MDIRFCYLPQPKTTDADGEGASENVEGKDGERALRRGGEGGQTTPTALDVRVAYKAHRGERYEAYCEIGLAAGHVFVLLAPGWLIKRAEGRDTGLIARLD
jgi:hypothetical protein